MLSSPIFPIKIAVADEVDLVAGDEGLLIRQSDAADGGHVHSYPLDADTEGRAPVCDPVCTGVLCTVPGGPDAGCSGIAGRYVRGAVHVYGVLSVSAAHGEGTDSRQPRKSGWVCRRDEPDVPIQE